MGRKAAGRPFGAKDKAPRARYRQLRKETPEVEAILDGKGFAGRSDTVADIEWVYANLHRREVDMEGIPSRGAWGLLSWARQNVDAFYQQMVSKVLGKGRGGVEGEEGEQARMQVAEVKRILAKYLEMTGSVEVGG